MAAREDVRVGIVGLGLMGGTHRAAYELARSEGLGCRVVAVCDQDADRRDAQPLPGADPDAADVLEDPHELFARSDVELVSICTHTDSHVDLACAALASGKSVLVEKPVALGSDEVERLVIAEESAAGFCMPAMCMRFWPGWSWLKAAVDDRRHGALVSAVFRRFSPMPQWAPEFYARRDRSGSALFDLHVHDVDLVTWLFGRPAALRAHGTHEHLTTLYEFPNGPPHVTAEGGWLPGGVPFSMGYTAVFENACASFVYGAAPEVTLIVDREPSTTWGAGASEAAGSPARTGYDGEIRHALAACRGGRLAVTLADALAVTRLLEAERASLEQGTRVELAQDA